ncbi:MAG: D-alanyl-D-alanine carboxypeptidase/D-alanyl-D-alanine-endopeptidase [Longimonas sp.]|uniref:D-alanyl-D-alanine carboxypeptidase/D-alanyl-D-alanine endopeptidase n=1 Tax=Longimonas sp. TaxID=2039626 RepID=UPI003355C670
MRTASRHCISMLLIATLFVLVDVAPAIGQYSWQSQMRDTIRATVEGHDSGGTWSVMVVNLDTGEPVVDYRGQATMIPASTVKILTSAAALELLGPDFRYETVLTTTGPVEGGRVNGDLVLHGAGDPSLGQHRATSSIFTNWAQGLSRIGIEQVSGQVIGDDSLFDAPGIAPGWSWDDIPYGYAAQSSALSYYGNVVRITLDALQGGSDVRIRWLPNNTSYVTVGHQLEQGQRGQQLWRRFERDLGQNTIHVRGTIPAGRSTQFRVSIDNPTLFSAYVFSEALDQTGITVRDGATTVRLLDAPPAPYDTLASVYSPPLSELVKTVNQESDNLYAEQLLHTLGAMAHGDSLSVTSSRERGLRLVRGLIHRAGGAPERTRLVDGSGLSRYNLVSAEVLVQVLAYMHGHPDSEVRRAFFRSLPVGGRDGTLQFRFQRAAAARGNVRAKTGTFSNNSALAGYVTSFEGTPFAFAVLANNHVGSTRPLRTVQDQIVNILAQYPR